MKRLSAFLLLFLLTDCHPATTGPRPLRVAYRAMMMSLDPIVENSLIANSINANIYEPLVMRNDELRVIPMLAVDWSAPDDHTWILELRTHVHFHDGKLLTADDVKFSLERTLTDPNSKIRDTLSMISSIEVLNPHRIKISTKQPFSILLTRLSEILIVSKSYFDRSHSSSGFPPGTGPYRVKSWLPGRAIELERNGNYWGAKPEIQAVDFFAVPEMKTRIQGLIQGRYDLLPVLEPSALDDVSLKKNQEVRIVGSTGMGVIYLGMDLRNERSPYVSGPTTNPFRDIRVRQAICKAINVSHVTKDILKGYAIEAEEMVAPAIFGFNEQIKRPGYDPVAAKRLMADAGYENGFTVRFDFSNNRYRCDEEIGKSIANDLEKIKIHVQTNSIPKEKLFPTLNARDTSFYMVGWYLSTPDASSALDYVIHSEDKARGYGSENVGGYKNAAVDQLIESGDSMIRQDMRAETLKEAMKLAMEDLPYIPLHVESTLAASASGIVWTPRPDDFIYAKDIHFKR